MESKKLIELEENKPTEIAIETDDDEKFEVYEEKKIEPNNELLQFPTISD